jgi:branched-chain amino acid transport system permease protein
LAAFLQQFVNGISLGAIYALCALGYTMVYGVLRFINFAHGDVFMAGAFAGYYLAPQAARIFPPQSLAGALFVLAGAMLVCAVLGIVIERLAYRPLRDQPKLTVLISAIGVSLFLEFAGQKFFLADPKPFPALLPQVQYYPWRDLVISSNQLIVIGLSVFLLGALRFIVLKTKMGIAMRAVAFNPQAASLVGIDLDRIISFTFALGSALAAAAGILYAMNYPAIDPMMGVMPGLKAFVAAVLGGIGNIPGAALGGLIIGLVETFVGGTAWSSYRDAIAFAILIVILLVKPAGLCGRLEVEKV